ncbi:MAG: PepSY-associated TM helix domain-containing protein [Verrucomicrobiota bacterium]
MAREKKDPVSKPMKVPGLNTRWYEAHSLAGIFILIPLFVILVAGTISFYRNELVVWHTPALRFEVPEKLDSVDAMLASEIQKVPQDARSLSIYFPTDYSPAVRLRWFLEGQSDAEELLLNPNNGSLIEENTVSTKLAMLIYHWHYLRPLPMGLYISGFIALLWFAATVSGVYIHRKKLISQFKGWGGSGARAFQSWLHTVAGTLTLPLHFVYGATGALFGLNTIALPLVVILAFGGDQDKALQELLGREPPAEFAGKLVDALPPLDPFLEAASENIPDDATLIDLSMQQPFDQAAELHAHYLEASGERGEVTFGLYEGPESIQVIGSENAPGGLQVLMMAFQLHFGHIGGYFGRFIFFLGGILLALLTYAGARLWVIRKKRDLPRATGIFERLFDGFALGMLPAIGIYAWANRLLPYSVPERGIVEMWIFHGAWVSIGLAIFIFGTGAACRKWIFRSSMILLGLIPVLDGLFQRAWPWSAASWVAPSFAITNLVLIASAATWLGLTLFRSKALK